MLIVVVVILIIAVLGLIGYNLNIHKKIQTYKNINQKIKLKRINILIMKSTI